MPMIVTRQQAMDHLKIDDATDEADDLDLKILAASAIVLDFLETEASDYADSSDDSGDSSGSGSSGGSGSTTYDWPYQLQAATLLLVGDMHRYRDTGIPTYSDTQLPQAVRAILFPLKSWGLSDT